MALRQVALGGLWVSQFIIGGNPFSGFSHQSPEMSAAMKAYYTPERIRRTWREAELLGVNTCIGRADAHIMGVLQDYWAEGGTIQWIAQTASEAPTPVEGARIAAQAKSSACFIHGGVVDYLLAQGMGAVLREAVQVIQDAGKPAGIAGHKPEVFAWAEEHLELDFYMCSYYNPSPRDQNPHHRQNVEEQFLEEDRQAMAAMIRKLHRPVIHYKVLAAGRNDPRSAFDFVARTMRPGDAVCVGVYTERKPDMLEEDIRLLEESLRRHGLVS